MLNAIGSSLEGIDPDALGDLSIGESLLNAIGSSLENIDVKELDIGSKIMESISASMESVDCSSLITPIVEQLNELAEIECNPVITVTDEASEIIITAQGLADTFGSTMATATLSANDNASSVISSVSAKLDALNGKTATVTINVQQNGTIPSGAHFASGTMDAPGGWAVINDQRGGSDATELVEQNGMLMEFAGRDIGIPLARHAKVYTASQRKRMLEAINMPHYARGKDNEGITFTPLNTIGTTGEIPLSDSGSTSSSGEENISESTGVQVHINMSPSITIQSKDGDENKIAESIRSNFRSMADSVADELANRLGKIFGNMPVKGGAY